MAARAACVETTGALDPNTVTHLSSLAEQAKAKGGRDATQYGARRFSATSFFPHHVAEVATSVQHHEALTVLQSAAAATLALLRVTA